MSLGGGIAHCVTILFCSGHYHLLYGIVEVVVAHGKLQETENHFPDKTVDDKVICINRYNCPATTQVEIFGQVLPINL